MSNNENNQYAVVIVRTGIITNEVFHSVLFFQTEKGAEDYVQEQISNPCYCLDLSISIIEMSVYNNSVHAKQFNVLSSQHKSKNHDLSTTNK